MTDPHKSLDEELADALAAEDVRAALEDLLRRQASDAAARRQVADMLALVRRLEQVRQAVDLAPANPAAVPELLIRRPVLWPVAAAAAAALALATWCIAPAGRQHHLPNARDVALVTASSVPAEGDSGATLTVGMPSAAETAVSVSVTVEMPPSSEMPVAPACSLEWPTVEMPALSVPSVSLTDVTFSVPKIEGSLTVERSEGNDT